MISIITINLNNSNGLLLTLLSVLQYKNKWNFEYIVVDGLSIDDSKDLLMNYSNSIDTLISEKDQGIYNAMNKGIKFCTNDYVLFLNSGDYFVKSINFTTLLNNNYNFDLIYGDILDCGDFAQHKVKYPDKLSFNYMLCGGLPHQATLIRKTLFDKVGFYEERYKIISDWVFFMEALFYHNATYKHIPHAISVYEGGGLSSLPISTNLILWEQIDYIKKRFPSSIIFYKSNSPYVKKYLRRKSRIFRWFYKFLLFKFNIVIK